MNKDTQVKFRLLLILIGSLCMAGSLTAGPLDSYELLHPDIDWPMYGEPYFDSPAAQYDFDPKLTDLWLKALARPEAELQFRAAEAIKRAYEMGMTELAEKVNKPLIEALKDTDRQPVVYRAVVEALVAMDVRNAASAMLEANQHGDREVVLLTDAALAAWDNDQAPTIWQQRMTAADVPVFLKISAIQSLGIVNDQSAVEALLKLALDFNQVQGIRISAAKSLGKIAYNKMADHARQFVSSTNVVNRLIAVHMLNARRHTESRQLLMQLAADQESAIATIAIRKLLADDPLHLTPLLNNLIVSDNANHRAAAVVVLEAEKNVNSTAKLALLLADPNTPVRVEAGRSLVRLAKQSHLNDTVRNECMLMLSRDDWRSIEQAAMVLGQLDHEPAASKLIDYLEHPRHEVRLATVVALRKLAVKETYTALLERIKYLLPNYPKGSSNKNWSHHTLELSQLCQAMGVLNYRPAKQTLVRLVPKASIGGGMARCAAIWALGHLHVGVPDDALASKFAGRLADVRGLDHESDGVRQFSTIAIGLMKAKGHHGVLEEFYETSTEAATIRLTCCWALEQTEDKAYSPPPMHIRHARGWFIEPIFKK